MWKPGQEDAETPKYDDLSDLKIVEIKLTDRSFVKYSESNSFRGKVKHFLNERADTRRETYLTAGIVILLVVVFILQCMFGLDEVADAGASSWPTVVGKGQVYRLFTCMFLHGSLSHLLGNLLVLTMCAGMLEQRISRKRLLILYFGGGLIASVTSVVFNHLIPMRLNIGTWFGEVSYEIYDPSSVGASGAIAALVSGLILYLIFLSDQKEFLSGAGTSRKSTLSFFGFLLLFIVVRGIFTKQDFVDTYAHLGGFIGGMAIMLAFALAEYRRNR